MKRLRNISLAGVLLACALMALMAVVAIAGNVGERKVVALPLTTGSAVWTNDYTYSALNLKRLSVLYSLDAVSTVTVNRVTSDGLYTQAVGSVVCVAGLGTQATLTQDYMKPADMLRIANSTATGATFIVEFEVQQH